MLYSLFSSSSAGAIFDFTMVFISVIDAISDALVAKEFYDNGQTFFFWAVGIIFLCGSTVDAFLFVVEVLQGGNLKEEQWYAWIPQTICLIPVGPFLPFFNYLIEEHNLFGWSTKAPQLYNKVKPSKNRNKKKGVPSKSRFNVSSSSGDDDNGEDDDSDLSSKIDSAISLRAATFFMINLQTIVESIPNCVLQLIAISTTGKNQVSGMQVFSLALSLASIAVKSFQLARTWNLRVLVAKFLFLTHDLFAIAFLSSTLFTDLVPESEKTMTLNLSSVVRNVFPPPPFSFFWSWVSQDPDAWTLQVTPLTYFWVVSELITVAVLVTVGVTWFLTLVYTDTHITFGTKCLVLVIYYIALCCLLIPAMFIHQGMSLSWLVMAEFFALPYDWQTQRECLHFISDFLFPQKYHKRVFEAFDWSKVFGLDGVRKFLKDIQNWKPPKSMKNSPQKLRMGTRPVASAENFLHNYASIHCAPSSSSSSSEHHELLNTNVTEPSTSLPSTTTEIMTIPDSSTFRIRHFLLSQLVKLQTQNYSNSLPQNNQVEEAKILLFFDHSLHQDVNDDFGEWITGPDSRERFSSISSVRFVIEASFILFVKPVFREILNRWKAFDEKEKTIQDKVLYLLSEFYAWLTDTRPSPSLNHNQNLNLGILIFCLATCIPMMFFSFLFPFLHFLLYSPYYHQQQIDIMTITWWATMIPFAISIWFMRDWFASVVSGFIFGSVGNRGVNLFNDMRKNVLGTYFKISPFAKVFRKMVVPDSRVIPSDCVERHVAEFLTADMVKLQLVSSSSSSSSSKKKNKENQRNKPRTDEEFQQLEEFVEDLLR